MFEKFKKNYFKKRKNNENKQTLSLTPVNREDKSHYSTKENTIKNSRKKSIYQLRNNNEYEKEVLQADIESFATEHGLAPDFTSRILHQYFMDTKTVTREYLRQELSKTGIKGLLKITSLIGKMLNFLNDCYNKFTAEGE